MGAGIARVDDGGMNPVMDQPKIIILERGHG
jgi:hypothetical protein